MKIPLLAVIATVLVLTAGCGGRNAPTHLVPTEYLGWASTVDGALVYQIPGHTMGMRKIYLNETGTNLKVTERAGQVIHEYPEGTIILKENYPTAESTAPAVLSVMIKAHNDMRSRGGWIWVAKDLATGGERIFSDEFCFTCHQNANEEHPYGDGNSRREFRDFVYYPWRVNP